MVSLSVLRSHERKVLHYGQFFDLTNVKSFTMVNSSTSWTSSLHYDQFFDLKNLKSSLWSALRPHERHVLHYGQLCSKFPTTFWESRPHHFLRYTLTSFKKCRVFQKLRPPFLQVTLRYVLSEALFGSFSLRHFWCFLLFPSHPFSLLLIHEFSGRKGCSWYGLTYCEDSKCCLIHFFLTFVSEKEVFNQSSKIWR